MPKVLRIINRFNIGGPTYNATFLTRFISDEYETLLIGGLPEKDEKDSLHILEHYGVKAELIPSMQRIPNFRSDRKAYKELKKIIRDFQPDIVHTHAAKAGALGRKAAFACKVPVVVHTFHGHVFHSYFSAWKTSIFKFIERRLAKKSTGIIAISPIQKEELWKEHRVCPADKIKVIPLGFDLTRFHEARKTQREISRSQWNLSEDEVAVAIVGRLVPIKNHSLFLSVIEQLCERKIKARFFIVGDGSEKEILLEKAKVLTESFGVEITFTSWIKDIAHFNAGMDVICLTSDNEGTPVSLIEAQASGVPIVSTDVGGVRDIVSEGETGFVVPKKNVTAFEEKLSFLIKNKNIREKMSQNGWSYVQTKFSYQRLVKDMEEYYSELLEKKKR